ncbi:FAD-dependent monooxygenase [Mycolicibacterium septicum]|uniref:FAD-dependent monooxygenase n=1 Tax=Mycolicibacterium septicum TaxID=98668 RepID=UPI00235ED72D|nr:FAD-dependent monooxygenase [Mycolicibacterium septicum]
MSRHVVISGAGIAGPALAHLLGQRGWRTTVVERYPERRDEGQNVDIRGEAREVVRRMGIDADIRAAHTGEVGLRILDRNGSPTASFPTTSPGEIDGPTAELEILRGELSRIVIDHSRPNTDYRFGTQITDLTDHGDGVSVALDDGTSLDADLVVIAEGMRSRTRKFVTAAEVDEFGMYFAYVTIPRGGTHDQWWNWQPLPRSRAVHLRPDNLGGTRAMLTFICDVRGLDALSASDQVTILQQTFADGGDLAQRVLAALDDKAPLYFSAVGRLLAPIWSKGRIALLGDTAFCPATGGGGGTSLALIGAYVLAGELAATDDQRAALFRYEQLMRKHVAATPPALQRMLRLTSPRTRGGIRALHAGARIMSSPVGQAVMKVAGRQPVHVSADAVPLPDYPDTCLPGGS